MVRMKNAVHHQALTRRAGEDVLLLESVTRSLPQIALGMPTIGIRSCPIFTFSYLCAEVPRISLSEF